MLERLAPGVTTIAVVSFFVLAMAVPYIAVRAVSTAQAARQAGLVAAVVSYLAAVLAYTILPLPEAEEMARRCTTGAGAQARLVPLGFLADLAAGSPGPSGLWWQVVLNVALFVPFGLALGWMLPLGRVALLALAASLLIELTQLTGLWFVYECAYRTFDVDDVVAGVLGACLGWALARLLRAGKPPGPAVRN
ncbi:MAG TPA: VanZ family protein [Ornithinimicrobium sp.]|uniref:VanZ family protein n=1 Tax=Ornithinimicrobium sp. TaxID=1977084 RepID=UPI002B4A7605|nr:VanZ family protein [Ornithinimicrobium sp.]HKJ12997.1 VanZ family protein [Ornithinimicrobium sp.]